MLMAKILKGAPVAAALSERMTADVAMLRGNGVEPCLAIVRVGARAEAGKGECRERKCPG